MQTYQSVADITDELFSRLEDPKFLKLDNGDVVIQFEQIGILIANLPHVSRFMLVAILGALPTLEADRLYLCEKLLHGNSFFLATGGFALAVTKGMGVMLQGQFHYSDLHEPGDAFNLIENFMNVANYWKNQCNLETINDRDKPFDDPFAMFLEAGIRV